jgi:TonB family protein
MTLPTPTFRTRIVTAALAALLATPLLGHAANPAPVVVASANPTAAPAVITYYSDDPAKWGTPFAWQPPAYPQALSEQNVTGKVDLIVEVTPEGKLGQIVAIRSTPAQPAFEDAVRKAVGDWTFNKAMDAECKPVVTRGQIQVRFDMADGKPQVNVGAISADKQAGRMLIQELNRREVNQALVDNYPRDARRMGKTGEVHALLKVDAQSGATKSVDITEVFADNNSYNPEPVMRAGGKTDRLPGRTSPASIQFATAAREQLEALRFTPVADAGQGTINVCREVAFKMKGVRRD